MKSPVTQPGQSTAVHAYPNAPVAALEPRAHAVVRQVVLCGETLKSSVRQDVKKSVAVMVEPQAAVAVLVLAHCPARGAAQQATPRGCLRHPRPVFHFAKQIA